MYFFGVMILMVTVILKVCDFFFFSESRGKLLIVSKAMQDTGEALQPGRWLVNTIPVRTFARLRIFDTHAHFCDSLVCAIVGSRCRVQAMGEMGKGQDL